MYLFRRKLGAMENMSMPGPLSDALSILTYHAVTPTGPPLDDWCFLPLKRFAAQMAFLHRFGFHVLPLDEALDALKAGTLKPRSVAITFDDGYRNNVTSALPVLENYGFPATVYVATGLIGSDKALWPNRVVAAIENTRKSSIEFHGNVMSLGSRKDRVRASRDLQRLIKRVFAANTNAGAEEVENICGTAVNPGFRHDHHFSMLDAQTMRETAQKGLMDFGAHTITHPILSGLSDDAVKTEISGSISQVEEASGQACRHFAYPNGSRADFDERAVNLLRAHGLVSAVTTREGCASAQDDPLLLPRWGVGSDVTIIQFVSMVTGMYPRKSVRSVVRAKLRLLLNR